MRSLLFSFLLFAALGAAGGSRYAAQLAIPDSTAFYKVDIPPALLALLKDDASNLRIIDGAGKEVPYLFRIEQDSEQTLFREYEITERVHLPDSLTRITLRNARRDKISNFSLQIRNADVQKTLRLTGSMDGKQWYVVRESALFTSIRNTRDVSEIRMVDFPLTDYLYYRLEIDDRHSAPLDILRAGCYESRGSKATCRPVQVTWQATDSSKMHATWIHILYDKAYDVDALEFSVKEPAMFLRTANIYLPAAYHGKIMRRLHSSVVFNSTYPLRFPLGIRTREMWLEIQNGDNNPLVFSSIASCQVPRYCIARFEKGKSYKLMLGDTLLHAPNYDLAYFESAIPSGLATLEPGKAVPLQTPVAATEAPSLFSDKRFMWASLGIVIVLLASATFKMIRELK